MALAAGTKLGPYEIESAIGAGGMGEVYRARDTRLERTVAIKVLPSHLSDNPDLKQRFEREARAISSLNHPHICTLHDVGTQAGVDFLVLEYLEGETLAERLAKGALKIDEALKIAVDVCDALDKAHRQGIVHRDLKPANVMLTNSGAKLMDFGLAKPALAIAAGAAGQVTPNTPTMSVQSLAAPASPLTQKGTIVGTFQYMAPEVLQGAEADARSDVFSFGCVLYEMITGRRAFEGKSQISVLAAILEKEPESISASQPLTPAALDYTIRTCLAKNPDERYAAAHDVALQLKWIAGAGAKTAAAPARPLFHRYLGYAAITVLVIAGAAAGYFAHQASPAALIQASIEMPAGQQLEVSDNNIALSADGKNLAIVASDHAGKTRIWMRSLDSTKWQQPAGTDGATYPFWSADGRNLAFFAEGKLKKMDVSSGAIQVLCDAPNGRGGSWGSRGQIVFAPQPFGAIQMVSADGGTPLRITDTPDNTNATDRMPHFLPDGEHVLFFRGVNNDLQDKNNGVYLIDVKTKHVQQVMSSAWEGLYIAPGYLVYARDRNLMAQRFDPSSGRVFGSPAVIVEDVILNNSRYTGSYALSQNGVLVALTLSQAPKVQLTWFDLDGKRLGTLGPPEILENLPQISNDDRHVLTQTGDPSQATTIATWYDIARGIGTKLTIPDHEVSGLSPDGRTLLYTSTNGELKTYALDGSAPTATVYTTKNIPYVTAWAPDGHSALFCLQQQGGMEYHLLSLPSRESRKLALSQGGSCVATYSPDGRWVAYQSEESGQSEIYVVPTSNWSNRRQVSSGGGFYPVWIGDRIFYFTAQRKFMTVGIKESNNSLEIGVAKELLPGQPFAGVAIQQGMVGTGEYVTHDGKRALLPVALDENAPPLKLVTNWMDVLKK